MFSTLEDKGFRWPGQMGEAFMFLPILPLAAAAVAEEDRPFAAAVRGGALFAGCIAAGYGLAYFALEMIPS